MQIFPFRDILFFCYHRWNVSSSYCKIIHLCNFRNVGSIKWFTPPEFYYSSDKVAHVSQVDRVRGVIKDLIHTRFISRRHAVSSPREFSCLRQTSRKCLIMNNYQNNHTATSQNTRLCKRWQCFENGEKGGRGMTPLPTIQEILYLLSCCGSRL